MNASAALDAVGKMTRWRSTATTWAGKATALLTSLHGDRRLTWLVGYEAELLLTRLLDESEELAELVNEEQIEDVERQARKVADRLRARRRAAKLSNVTGRTPAEAALFAERAAELRGVSRGLGEGTPTA